MFHMVLNKTLLLKVQTDTSLETEVEPLENEDNVELEQAGEIPCFSSRTSFPISSTISFPSQGDTTGLGIIKSI